MNTSNLKDTITTYAGIIFGAATSVLTYGVSAGITYPAWVNTTCGIVITVTGLVLFILTGKNPNLTTKSETQVAKQNEEAK